MTKSATSATRTRLRRAAASHARTNGTEKAKLTPQVLVYGKGAAGRGLTLANAETLICAKGGWTSFPTRSLCTMLAGKRCWNGVASEPCGAAMPRKPPRMTNPRKAVPIAQSAGERKSLGRTVVDVDEDNGGGEIQAGPIGETDQAGVRAGYLDDAQQHPEQEQRPDAQGLG